MSKFISVVIIAKNESRCISECLKAAFQVSDDIVLVDSGSTDNTMDIAIKLGATVYQVEWMGYGATKNWGNKKAQNDWILSLDADEILEPELIEAIKSLSLKEEQVYWLNRIVTFEGLRIRHSGWHPDWIPRLFNRQTAEWNTAEVHERLIYPKSHKKIKLKGLLLHNSYQSIDHMRQKYDHYARLGAKNWIKRNKKPSSLKMVFGSSFRFFKHYIIQLGFLDGKMGWLIAKESAKMVAKRWKYYRSLKE